MKRCDKCQERQATVHMTDVSGSEIQDETHLCSQCAESEGLQYNVDLDLSDLIPDDLNIDELDKLREREEELADLECPQCGLTFDEFRETRRLGCPNDYEVFSRGLDPILEQIHDKLEHTGKVPSGVDQFVQVEHQIQKLERELQAAVSEEEFEKAADLRDEIKNLKEELDEMKDEAPDETSDSSSSEKENES